VTNLQPVHLTKRLTAIAQQVPQGSRLADIGSDHALVPIHLVQTGQIQFAIAGEVIPGPLSRATQAIEAAELTQQIQPRLADGLAAIQPADQVDTVVIAGMGGQLICDILAAGQPHKNGIQRLILEPNIQEDLVRQWLGAHRYQIVAETIVAEDQHVYEIIVAELTAKVIQYSPAALKFGPCLMQEKSQVFRAKWRHRYETNEKIEANLRNNARGDQSQKLAALTVENKMIQEAWQ
jgi:tRNA (adenine22-N1)-methyltransferase